MVADGDTISGFSGLSERRKFAGFQEGTHVPGYLGFCPQMKYRAGKTFGQDTHELCKSSTLHVHPLEVVPPDIPQRQLTNVIPESTGDNKYTQQMVPGYTGYVPRWPYKHGNTYKTVCDNCVDEFISMNQKERGRSAELSNITTMQRGQMAMTRDPIVKRQMNLYRDTHPTGQPTLTSHKRGSTEPPIPGYQGFIPRIVPTDLGLGCRYHHSTKNGLENFFTTIKKDGAHGTTRIPPIVLGREPSQSYSRSAGFTKRIYMPEGMIPKYTGYCPQQQYNVGHTYGDTTRSLDVCSHKKEAYGDFVRSKTMMASI